MFLVHAFTLQNKPIKYLIGFLSFCLLFVVGQIPLYLYVKYLIDSKGIQPPTKDSDVFLMMPSSLALFLYTLSFVSVFIGMPYILKKIHKLSFIKIITSRSKIDYKRVAFAFGIWTFVLLITMIIGYYFNPEHYIFQFNWTKFLILIGVSVLVLPIQSTVEELLFRGYLMQGFGLVFNNKLVALLITSILFGLMHGLNPEVSKLGNMVMIYYIGTGLFLGVITLMDEGVELAIGFHVANNLIGALLLTTDWGALQTDAIWRDTSEPNIIYQILFPVCVVYPIVLIIFAKRYQWVNWKQKLTANIIFNSN